MQTYPLLLLAFAVDAPRLKSPMKDRELFMKIHMFLAAGVGALVLAGCSSADEKPRKGKYKPEVELTALELPGITAEMRQQAEAEMKANFASQVGGEQCLGATKKDEWKKASEQIRTGLGGKCTEVRNVGSDSSIDLEVKCTGTPMGDVTALIKGEAQSESFGMDINLNLDKLATGGTGKLGMKISAKRTGDC
jgi:hypothetical protein